MKFVIELSRQNCMHQTGGPFGAAIFEIESGKLIAPGVNLVAPHNNSTLHAEMVAIAMAQAKLKSFTLNIPDLPAMELIASTEPCAMCYGATPWSGVKRLIYGAASENAQAVGFDEGDKPVDWISSLVSRGISVIPELLHAQAKAVLEAYAAQGGIIYNGKK